MIGMSYVQKIEFAINKECIAPSASALTTSYIKIFEKKDIRDNSSKKKAVAVLSSSSS